MKDLGNTIYAFGYVVAATVLGIGVADYWFGNHQLTAFLSWAVLATIPWLVGRASLYVLASLEAGRLHWLKVKNPNAPAVKREAEEDWGR
jgi:biotin transporter BioY